YIVMEYIEGKTLKDLIREKGKFTVNETLNYSIQIAEALEHAHKNHIVHRDIKPHNIMVTEDGRVKVTDFGIARAATTSTVTNTSNVIGSVHYFSPEQARGGYTDEKSDIYSLGIVMYEMITGKVPFEGDSPITVALKHIQEEIIPPRDMDDTVPIGLQNIIMRCVKKSQVDRYSTAGELLSDLKRLRYIGEDLPLEEINRIEEATQIIPAVKDKDENTMKKSNRRKKQSDGGLKIVFLAILLAFIVVSSLALGFFKLKDYFISTEVVVPDLKGMYKEEAKEEVEKLGLEFSVVNEVFNNEFEKDQVVNQRTKAGEKVKEGYTIEVTVSKGNNLVKVPNLVNENISEIDDLLKEANLVEVVDYDYSDTVEANIIISQSPDAYSEVEEGTKINLVVSQGPKKEYVIMPKLIGLSEEQAKNALVAYGLVLDQAVPEPNDEYDEGIVFWQSIEQGTEIEANTAIDIYVSTGPAEEPEPEDTDKEIPFSVSITPASEEEEVEIKVLRVQDGNREVVYNKVHKVDGKSVEIPLEGKLDAYFEFYYDDIYIDELPHPEG
ncbi:Stk1 family PASTA domain-containing Ser/Thr kinase, partial [Schnuerera sp.]|uniref:Stk1 family PASTA domain-containing Ser/Thr kinase n=1 Tax=Schnuerera sp. TaxID=2794844 RepID=UPI002D0DFC0B